MMIDITAPPIRPLVAASILSADFGHMTAECRDVLDKGADLLHIDVMDGHFAGNLTMGQDMIRGLRRHLPDTFLDVHLMVDRPGNYIDDFADAGANLFTFHLEACQPQKVDGDNASVLIERILATGMHAGMAINPPTAIDGLTPYLDQLALVLIMSVHPGRSGQQFIADVLEKTQILKTQLDMTTRLEMDGGINPSTAPSAAAAGVDVLVSASALFGADNRAAAIAQMHASDGHSQINCSQ